MQFFERRKDPRTVQFGQALVARAEAGFVVQLADVSKSGACLKRPPRFRRRDVSGSEPGGLLGSVLVEEHFATPGHSVAERPQVIGGLVEVDAARLTAAG